MSLISLTSSQSVLFSSSKEPYSFPSFSHRYSRNGNWISRKKRLHAKSADRDTDTSQVNVSSNSEGSSASASTSFLSVLCPLLKLFSGGDPARERNDTLEVATSSLSTLARLPWGSRSLSEGFETQELSNSEFPMRLQLFEFEACPFCRRVREAITELDLSVEVFPCPKGSVRHREMVRRSGGKELFPFLIDPNTGISMYESGDIVNYLFTQYGKGRSPSAWLLESTLITGWMPTLLRAGRGMTLWEKAKADPPPKKLELFSYENNPYARIVREALCELELPYILQNVGKGSPRIKLLTEISGSNKVPYLIDPNTGTQIGDYKKILSYLFEMYSASTI
ncbi:Thioredoxin family protein [Melia azedarach]|uniref:Thioredoxin family protein n=1 Tax=Melia azedarach TaxID=155640 RepID=A0ACC1XTZ5_MELAZ|nr:Thioredoxin family protein [Melia azedarach]